MYPLDNGKGCIGLRPRNAKGRRPGAYPQISMLVEGEPTPTQASHASLHLFKGEPLPLRGVPMHSCDVPECINPEHLSVGTQSDNVQDAIRKGRYRNGALAKKMGTVQ